MIKAERLSLREYTKERFQGISCAFMEPSEKIHAKYEGFADRENNLLVDENTIFPACSISKFVTALCVMKTYERGLTDIDAPVNRHLSRWKLRAADGNESDASIRSLLSHTAGVFDGVDGFYGLRRNDPLISLTVILEGKTRYNNRPTRVENPPGTEFEYSDAGYCILQLLLEELIKKPFEEIAKEYFFDPLNLKHTFFASPENVAYYEKEYVMATGYDENGQPIPGKYPGIPDLAASGLWSTPSELLIIAKEFAKACNGRSSLLGKEAALKMAKPDEKFSWTGLGVFMGGENEIISRGWGENGQCMMKVNVITGEIAVVMTNQNPGVDQAESGIEGLINRRFDQ